MKLFLLFSLVLTVCGCASTGVVTLREQDYSLNQLQKVVIDNMPMGRRKVSANSREYWSNYFIVTPKGFRSGDDEPTRYTAHATILGDRRPYAIDMIVEVERKTKSGYAKTGTDQRIAKLLLRRILATLTKRREDPNLIDDFRVF